MRISGTWTSASDPLKAGKTIRMVFALRQLPRGENSRSRRPILTDLTIPEEPTVAVTKTLPPRKAGFFLSSCSMQNRNAGWD